MALTLSPIHDYSCLLWDGILFDRLDWVEEALSRGVSPDTADHNGVQALLLASCLYATKAVNHLLDAGAQFPPACDGSVLIAYVDGHTRLRAENSYDALYFFNGFDDSKTIELLLANLHESGNPDAFSVSRENAESCLMATSTSAFFVNANIDLAAEALHIEKDSSDHVLLAKSIASSLATFDHIPCGHRQSVPHYQYRNIDIQALPKMISQSITNSLDFLYSGKIKMVVVDFRDCFISMKSNVVIDRFDHHLLDKDDIPDDIYVESIRARPDAKTYIEVLQESHHSKHGVDYYANGVIFFSHDRTCIDEFIQLRPTSETSAKLSSALTWDDLDQFKVCLQDRADMHRFYMQNGYLRAMCMGSAKIAKYLFDKSPEVENYLRNLHVNHPQNPALNLTINQYSCGENCDSSFVLHLITRGFDVNLMDGDRMTPLMLAAAISPPPVNVLVALVDADADVSVLRAHVGDNGNNENLNNSLQVIDALQVKKRIMQIASGTNKTNNTMAYYGI